MRASIRSNQFSNHAAFVDHLDGATVGGLVGGVEGDAETVVNRGGEVFCRIRGFDRLLGDSTSTSMSGEISM